MQLSKASIYLSLLILLSSCVSEESKRDQLPPNVILIYADDLSMHQIGAYGQKVIKTPRIDKMASEGLLFTKAYSPSGACAPSRASVILGKHVGHITQRRNGAFSHVRAVEVGFPEFIQRNGIKTCMIGKNHNILSQGPRPLGDLPSDFGMDYFLGTLRAVDAHPYFLDGKTAPEKNIVQHLWEISHGTLKPHFVSPDTYTQDAYTERAKSYIEENKDSSFFMYLSLQIPHFELAIPRKSMPSFSSADAMIASWYQDENGNSIFNEVPWKETFGYNRPCSDPAFTQASMISRMDSDIGQIMDLLEDLNLRDNTYVIFTSDNGYQPVPGEDHFEMKSFVSGSKGRLQEGGVKVPFIVWGANIPEGSRINEPIIGYDLGATILGLVGIQETYITDGVSFANSFNNPAVLPTRSYLYWENPTAAICQATLIEGRYKVYKSNCKNQNYKLKVFDLEADPLEKNDISSSDYGVVLADKAKKIFRSEHVPYESYDIPN